LLLSAFSIMTSKKNVDHVLLTGVEFLFDIFLTPSQHGIMITKEELYARLNEERDDINQDITYIPEVKDPMATAVDIGEHSFNEDSDDEDEDVDKAAAQPESLEDEEDDAEEGEEKVSQNWSVLKSTGQAEKPKEKSKNGEMSLKEAIDDSENLTDFLMDFEEDE